MTITRPGTVLDRRAVRGCVTIETHDVTIRRNTLLNRFDQTSAVSLGTELGPTTDMVIARNLLAGGGYTLYCGMPDVRELVVFGNHFSTRFFPNAGRYGTNTGCDGVTRWRGNVVHETGRPVYARR